MDMMQGDHRPWPERAWILALLGLAGGVAIHFLLDGATPRTNEQARFAVATLLGAGLLAFAHAWMRGRLIAAILTGLVAGGVLALVFLWNGAPTSGWSGGESWRIVAAALSVFIFVPLAQAGGERGGSLPRRWSARELARWARTHFPYAVVHDHAWTNLLTAGLSVLFAGAFFLMLLLMGELFALIKVTLVRDWLREEAVIAGLWGAAIGASTGALRDRMRIISSLQTVAMTVLRIAAPVLAVALALFLLILPMMGLSALWDATRSTTPIVLSAGLVALVLVNSVIGNGAQDEARSQILRWAAMLLSVTMAPLALIAAVSTSLRVDQHGWSPERLWAATFVAMACVVSLSYLAVVLRRWRTWSEGLRDANLGLSFLICAVALLLSTPLVRFDDIATRDQVARLTGGQVRADLFDYRALWFDFGPAGRKAIVALGKSAPTVEMRRRARLVQQETSRYATGPQFAAEQRGPLLDRRLTVLPHPIPVEQGLRQRLIAYDMCDTSLSCLLVQEAGADHAVAVALPAKGCERCLPVIRLLYRGDGSWRDAPAATPVPGPENRARIDALVAAIRAGRMDVRPVERRQLFIDGKPYGEPIAQGERSSP